MLHRQRPWTALLAALLLLVPLALSAHVHPGHPGTDCAACVVSHHAPTVRAATPALSAPVVVRSALIAHALLAPASTDRPAHAGRGPPADFPSTSS
jgi:hypothetical protein